MEENVLGLIAEAESRASEIKAQALEQAAKIIAAAEKNAADISRSSEAECAEFREKSQTAAQNKAAADYEKTINDSRAEAASYADSILEYASIHVTDIVGRLTK